MKNLNLYKVIVLLALSLFSVNKASACHYGAADIYVKYIGAGQDGCTGTTDYSYEVTLTIYLACQDCTLDYGGTDVGQVFSANSGQGAITLNFTDIKGATADPDTVHQLCPSAVDSNSCKNLSNKLKYPAFRRRIFRTNVTLPSAQTDWVFSWTNGGRNTVPNIGACGNLYVEAMLNNVTKYNNSTPIFTSLPLPYLCVGQPNAFLNGPLDPNGDSVQVYQQVPYSAGPTACVYQPGYSNTDPIGSAASNPYQLNPTTGTATFTPKNSGFYVLAFRAEDYERGTGVKLGHVYRDVQVSVLNCTEPPPAIDSLTPAVTIANGTVVPVVGGSKAVVTCPGNNLTFTLNSKANTPGHTLYMYANTVNVPGSTFNAVGAGTDNITGTFAWTPATADIGEHTVIITSADSSCTANQPIVLKNYTVIYVKVIAGLDAGKDLATCELNPPSRQLSVKGYGNLKLRFKWTDINGGPAQYINNDTLFNPVSTSPKNTGYVVYSPDLKDKCKAYDTVFVYVDTQNTLDIFPHTENFVQCRPDYLQLDASVLGLGPISNLACGVATPRGCKTDSLIVYGTPTYGVGISIDTAGTTTPILTNQKLTLRYQFLIRRNELREYGLRSATLKSLAFETTRNQVPNYPYSNFTISLKCTNKEELKKSDGFETGMTQVYKAPGDVLFPDGWNKFNFDTEYDLDSSKNLVVEICISNNAAPAAPCTQFSGLSPIIKFMPTAYVGGLENIPPSPATASVCGVNQSADIKEFVTRPVFKFDYCESPGLPFLYNWTPGEYLSDSTIKQPLAYVNKSTKYMLETYGRNGCLLRDTINIFVPEHDFYALPKDTAICFGETAPLEIRNGTYYKWYEYENGQYKSAHQSLSCDLCANPIAKPKKTTHYKIAVGDEVFCFDTIDAYITVKPLPVVKILTPDTMVKAGQSLQLMVNGARLYNWSPVASLNNPNISYPIATPTESTMYVVAGIASNGCRSFDTVRVGVDYRSNLIIPTAFSPNADGKNDVFRVSNMTVQRYVEFRVFNRWGQEVYNGTDGRKGWDGTWKGVPQEIGNYQYLIRVAYPDGFVETYKGDVTLVR
ncbi:MAG: gliding motility-associated C-terminal domain-containing protein [Flavipsychrobacter sp.]